MELTTKSGTQARKNSQADYILVVDDLADNCFLLKTILEAEGYNVEVASDGRMALAKAEALLPRLMLLDVMMPDMNGYEVTQRIRQNAKLSNLPIVLITAYGEERAAIGKTVGANDFICKPFDFDELMQRVRTYTA